MPTRNNDATITIHTNAAETDHGKHLAKASREEVIYKITK